MTLKWRVCREAERPTRFGRTSPGVWESRDGRFRLVMEDGLDWTVFVNRDGTWKRESIIRYGIQAAKRHVEQISVREVIPVPVSRQKPHTLTVRRIEVAARDLLLRLGRLSEEHNTAPVVEALGHLALACAALNRALASGPVMQVWPPAPDQKGPDR